MKTILKKISLEEFTSRQPSVVPAYKDNTLYYFDNESLMERNYLYPSNYGMVPINVSISGFTDGNYGFCADFVHCNKKFDFSDNIKTFSFRSISDYYYFFKEYYHLLKDYGHCNMVYSSATQYYDEESKKRSYASDMEYGNDRAAYEALDSDFASMGGVVSASTIESFSAVSISDVADNGFYKFMCENIIPTFVIPKKYCEYWKRSVLYYPDVIKWMGWLNSRINYENDAYFITDSDGTEHWTCKNDNVKDCCDCEEYFNRGGKRILDEMKNWYEKVQNGISALNTLVREKENCFIPTMIQDVNLTVSIDNLGDMSVLSEEYKLGKDYRNAENLSASANTRTGTTIVYEDGTSKILSANSGFCFDSKYMEKVYNEDDWGDYTRKYVSDNINDFKIDYAFYAYDEDDKLITGNSKTDVKNKFYYYYEITPKNSVLINGSLYDVLKAEKGVYNGKQYFVYRDGITNTPYAIINGKKVFADFYPYGESEPYYYFTIFKDENYARKKAQNVDDRVDDIDDSFKNDNYQHFPRTVNDDELTEYIIYNGVSYEVGETSVVIDGMEYFRIKGYALDKYGENYYILKNGAIKYTDILIDTPTSTRIVDNMVEAAYEKSPIIYETRKIIGVTSSKLDLLKSRNPLNDDIGNVLNGLFNVNNKNNYNFQPKQGEELEPLYQVGNVYLGSDAQYKNTQIDQYSISSDTNYFVGSIITKMEFYYKNSDGTKNEGTKKEVELNDIGKTSLCAISASTEEKTRLENNENAIFDENIYCDITYYQGATISRKENENFILASGDTYNHGVKYHETVQFIKENEEYYLKKIKNNFLPFFKNKTENHSVSYPVKVYKIQQETKEVETNNGEIIQVPIAKFETEIPVWDENSNNSFDNKDISNNEEIYPVFKEEYMIGSSSMQNIDNKIFIDRGNNAAFEKHLKLGEVFSLEALQNYGNNWFKMIENN